MRHPLPRAALFLLLPLLACGARAATFTLGGYEATVSETDGALVLTGPGGGRVLATGSEGLWSVLLADGRIVTARGLLEAGGTLEATAEGEGLRLAYAAPDLAVTISVLPSAEGLDLRATLSPRDGVVLGFDLPARLRFAAEEVVRFVSPANANESVGTLFHRGFFLEQPADNPTGWAPEAAGPAGYIALAGGGLVERPVDDPPTPARVTDQGREVLGAELAGRIEGARVIANRPPGPDQADVVLIDTANGPWLSGSHLRGAGLLLRLGGIVRPDHAALALQAVVAALEAVARAGEATPRIAVLVVPAGSERGSWCDVAVRDWLTALRGSPTMQARRAEILEVSSPAELLGLLADGAHPLTAAINPYGEGLPLPEGLAMADAVAAIGDYVRTGGCWVEVGGYPFFYALRPARALSYAMNYPAGFADFQFLETTGGAAALYRVAPRDWEPWAGASDPTKVFTPGSLSCGRDALGAFCQRSFRPYVAAGASWTSPTVRLDPGREPEEALRRYARANRLTRPLSEKIAPDRLEAFRQSLLLLYHGNAREALADIPRLPAPLLFHNTSYLMGGFDKQYPDHLPPNPGFGSAEDLRRVVEACEARGLFFMPYTNPTWWCDHPRGPTFAEKGEGALARSLEGTPYHEQYAANDGWTITFWRPEVQQANRRTVRQFTEGYPVGVLFQDQCGARGWVYDTNEGSPRPDAYTEGLISMVDEDSRRAPLSTENGWDRILAYESQFCGMTWGLTPPTRSAMTGLRLYRERFPAGTWEPYPLAQFLGHDSVAMIHHDLGQFVTGPEMLAWTLGLGYGMSFVATPGALRDGPTRDWIEWLATLQRAVCSRYTGVALDAFSIPRDDPANLADIALLRSRYGDVSVVANTAAEPRSFEEVRLAPYGYRVTAPGVEAGGLAADEGEQWYVREEQPDGGLLVTLHAPQDAVASAPMPEGWDGARATEAPEGLTARVEGTTLHVRTGHRAGDAPLTPPAELASLAPRDWPADRRPTKVGVLSMAGLQPSWIRFGPEDWIADLSASPALRAAGLSVEAIATPAALRRALAEGPSTWFAVVNPYGEVLPCAEGLDGEAMLGALRAYVRQGGIWWEVAGYSLYQARSLQPDGSWATEPLGPSGLGRYGIQPAGDAVDAPPVPLQVTPLGGELLTPPVRELVGSHPAATNRAAQAGSSPAHETLVASEGRDYVAGYRLGGWGWLWRIGGFDPPRELVTPLVADALAALYGRAPLPPPTDPARYVWRIRLTR